MKLDYPSMAVAASMRHADTPIVSVKRPGVATTNSSGYGGADTRAEIGNNDV